jgi:nucleotide-binding universal stress UspA family protein
MKKPTQKTNYKMKTIFVSTDFSARGNNAVKFAIHYTKAIKGKLIIFHSTHLTPFKPTLSEAAYLKLEKNTEEKQHKRLDMVVSKIYQEQGIKRDNKKVSIVVKNNVFAMEAIVSAAKAHHADLIIVGTHGATGLKLFGSTTSELIFKAETPVLAIPPRYHYKKIKTMVYATDFKNTVNELRCIVPIAKPLKATVEVLNLDYGMSSTKPILETKDLVKQVKFKKIKVIVQRDKQGLTLLEQIERYLKKYKPEVLVMFPEERSLFDKLFVRSKTEELVYDTKLPLLTFLKSNVKQ